MGNIREKFVFTAVLALFIAGAFFLLWRESAQVNLKSATRLYEANDPSALSIFKSGLRKNYDDYLLHYGVARTLHKADFAEMSRDKSGKRNLLDARRSINNALALRFDGYGYNLLAFNYELSGEEKKALAHYNISFFFSQNIGELKRWERMRPRQAETAREYFKANATGVSLIMAFNALSGYGAHSSVSGASAFLRDFFLSVSPIVWLNKDWAQGKRILQNRFKELEDADKEIVARQFENAGFGFLSRFLLSSV